MRKRGVDKRVWLVLGIVFAVLLVFFIGYTVVKYVSESKQYEEKEVQYIQLRQKSEKIIVPAPETAKESEEKLPLGGRAYDFDALKEENKDIIAWLYLPETEIDYPVFWNEDNTYYLEHNMDGSKGRPGCLYMESYNRTDFSDPLNIIYGHNMRNGTMFGTLKEFLDETYFKEHRSIYLYTPEGDREYRIIAVSLYSDEHLLADRIVADENGKLFFTGMVGNESLLLLEKIRAYGDKSALYDDTEEKIVKKDELLVLSTCSRDREKRLLIVGKRIDHTK